MSSSIILGVETSCDESAIALVENGRKIISSLVESQISIHETYGGVVPEIASRYHVKAITDLVEKTFQASDVKPEQLSAIACTQGPGLTGMLLVGLNASKALSYAWNLPLYGVNHLYAHVASCFLESDLEPPFLALLVSGGHTELYIFESYDSFKLVGRSLDDACGEAFDKIARILGLKYPGGPGLEKLACGGDLNYIKFPIAKINDFNFSFSGLKTNVFRYCQKNPDFDKSSVAACAQYAIVDALWEKTLLAIKTFKADKLVVCGGVSANEFLRQKFKQGLKIPVYYPNLKYCTDNAAMIASAAYFKPKAIGYDAKVFSRSGLDV